MEFVRIDNYTQFKELMEAYTRVGWVWNDGEKPLEFQPSKDGMDYCPIFISCENRFFFRFKEMDGFVVITLSEALKRLCQTTTNFNWTPCVPSIMILGSGTEGCMMTNYPVPTVLQNFTPPYFLTTPTLKKAYEELINSVPQTKKPMSISSMIKKLVDADTKTLMKAGFLDNELDLTEEGRAELDSIMFIANKAALVKAAAERIEEMKDEKDC